MAYTVTNGASVQLVGTITASPTLPQPTASQIIKKVFVSGKAGTALTAGTGALLYTVTGGKTLYVTSIDYGTFVAGGGAFELRDGLTIAGTVAYSSIGLQNAATVVALPTPVPFSTGVFVDVGTTQTYNFCLYGYEA